jgi:hypothetical protein
MDADNDSLRQVWRARRDSMRMSTPDSVRRARRDSMRMNAPDSVRRAWRVRRDSTAYRREERDE